MPQRISERSLMHSCSGSRSTNIRARKATGKKCLDSSALF